LQHEYVMAAVNMGYSGPNRKSMFCGRERDQTHGMGGELREGRWRPAAKEGG
jgi:hypothetical protein